MTTRAERASAVVDRLFYKAAVNLTGRRDVQVRVRMPSAKNSDGFACMDKQGLPLIEIRPGMSEERQLFVFCHECAHVKLHAKTWKGNPQVGAFMDDLPNNIESPREFFYRLGLKAQYDENEDQADKLGNTWVSYATTHTEGFGGETILEKWLKALASWMPPANHARMLRLAEEQGRKAVSEIIEFNKWKLNQMRMTRTSEEEFEEWKLKQLRLAGLTEQEYNENKKE